MTKEEAAGLVAQFGENFPELLALTKEAREEREQLFVSKTVTWAAAHDSERKARRRG